MMYYHLPWILISFFLTFLFMLAAREFFLIRSYPKGDPERGMAWFNALMLLVSLVLVVCGVRFLYAHERELENNFPAFPTSRYAPEREILTPRMLGARWIYVTKKSPDEVADFYQVFANANGYVFIRDESTTSTRMLFSKNDQKLFLTVLREGSLSVLHFSKEGTVSVVAPSTPAVP